MLFTASDFILLIMPHPQVLTALVLSALTYTVSQKRTSILLPMTLADVDGFLKFSHC